MLHFSGFYLGGSSGCSARRRQSQPHPPSLLCEPSHPQTRFLSSWLLLRKKRAGITAACCSRWQLSEMLLDLCVGQGTLGYSKVASAFSQHILELSPRCINSEFLISYRTAAVVFWLAALQENMLDLVLF